MTDPQVFDVPPRFARAPALGFARCGALAVWRAGGTGLFAIDGAEGRVIETEDPLRAVAGGLRGSQLVLRHSHGLSVLPLIGDPGPLAPIPDLLDTWAIDDRGRITVLSGVRRFPLLRRLRTAWAVASGVRPAIVQQVWRVSGTELEQIDEVPLPPAAHDWPDVALRLVVGRRDLDGRGHPPLPTAALAGQGQVLVCADREEIRVFDLLRGRWSAWITWAEPDALLEVAVDPGGRWLALWVNHEGDERLELRELPALGPGWRSSSIGLTRPSTLAVTRDGTVLVGTKDALRVWHRGVLEPTVHPCALHVQKGYRSIALCVDEDARRVALHCGTQVALWPMDAVVQ